MKKRFLTLILTCVLLLSMALPSAHATELSYQNEVGNVVYDATVRSTTAAELSDLRITPRDWAQSRESILSFFSEYDLLQPDSESSLIFAGASSELSLLESGDLIYQRDMAPYILCLIDGSVEPTRAAEMDAELS